MARSKRRVFGLVAAGLLPALVACNAIIGLSDFTKGECPGAYCGDGGGFDGAMPDAGADAQGEGGPGVAPVSWARWRMPNYPDASDNAPAYDTSAPDTITDTITGLTWRKATPAEAQNKTYDDAKAYCASLPNGPFRLPKRIELVSLLDPTKTPAISPEFQGTTASRYWTSSEHRPFGAGGIYEYWVVGFTNGEVTSQPTGTPASVRCVKGGQP